MSATEYLSHVKSGAISTGAIVLAFRAHAASTPIWAPVVLSAKTTGEYLPEVTTTTTLGDPTVIGVTVGPLVDASSGYVSDASYAVEMIEVCVHGICKLKMDGTDNVAIGDAIMSMNAAGYGRLATIDAPTTYLAATINTLFQYANACFAMALEAATVDGDTIPVFVYGAKGTPT